MKTHHMANLVLIVVMLFALAGIYYMFKGPGRAIELPAKTDKLGFCCCQDNNIFKVASSKLASELLPVDCAVTCSEHASASLGPC